MNVAIVRPSELGPREQERWRQIQRGNPALANPFLSVDFTMAVGRVRPRARVAILEDGQEIVGFFPYEVATHRVGRALGTGVSDCQGIVHVPELEWNLQALLKACQLDVWEFDHLLAGQVPCSYTRAVSHPSPIIDLSGGYDAYLKDRHKALRTTVQKTFRLQRKMARETGEVRLDFDARDLGALRKMMQWKSAQYQRTGQWDRFTRPWVIDLVSDLFEVRTQDCAGVLSVLYAGDRPAAAQLCLRSPSVLSSWFPSYNVEFSKYSPGLLAFFLIAEAAAGHGLQTLDLGKGGEQYKELLANAELEVAEGWVERRSMVALARRLQRAPGHQALDFVRSHPRLRQGARRARHHWERVRKAAYSRTLTALQHELGRETSDLPD
jgi:CelD/BcsL family acetyltransferase involved in cellulose biosynthesis